MASLELGPRVSTDDGVELAVRRRPGDGPALVLAHGITGHGGTWSALLERLPDSWDVIAYDARGHGASGHASVYSYALLAGDLAAVVRQLGLPRPVLAGHSMGAHTVALAAAADPGLAAAVVLEDPPWPARERPVAVGRRRAAAWRRELEGTAAGTVAARVEALRRLRPAWSDAERRRCAEAERCLDPRVTDIVADGAPGWRAAAAAIAVPLLLVHGDRGAGGIVSPEVAGQVAALHGTTRVEHLAGAGHNVRRDRPDAYAGALVDFLRQVIASAP